jgi:hypothetical protein
MEWVEGLAIAHAAGGSPDYARAQGQAAVWRAVADCNSE